MKYDQLRNVCRRIVSIFFVFPLSRCLRMPARFFFWLVRLDKWLDLWRSNSFAAVCLKRRAVWALSPDLTIDTTPFFALFSNGWTSCTADGTRLTWPRPRSLFCIEFNVKLLFDTDAEYNLLILVQVLRVYEYLRVQRVSYGKFRNVLYRLHTGIKCLHVFLTGALVARGSASRCRDRRNGASFESQHIHVVGLEHYPHVHLCRCWSPWLRWPTTSRMQSRFCYFQRSTGAFYVRVYSMNKSNSKSENT